MNTRQNSFCIKAIFYLCTALIAGTVSVNASVNDIFYVLNKATILNPAATTINPPAGFPYSAVVPVSGTTWNQVDQNTTLGANLAVGTYTYSANNQAAGGVVKDAAGNTLSGVSLTITYNCVTATGSHGDPSSGTAGENTLQPGGITGGVPWRLYNGGGNYMTLSFAGLPASKPFKLYFYGVSGTSSSSTSGGRVGLVSANQNGAPIFDTTAPAAAANSAGNYGAIWTVSGGVTNLLATSQAYKILNGVTDGSGNFSMVYSNAGGSYLNGFQLVQVPSSNSVTGGGSDCTSVPVGLSGSETGVSYQLYNNGNAVGSPVSGSGSSLSWSATSSGTYTVVGTITDGTTTGMTNAMTGSAVVTILPPTTVSAATVSPSSSVSVGANVMISVTTGGTAPTTYVWAKNGVTLANGLQTSGSTISGADTATLIITDVQLGDAASSGQGYTCTVSGGCSSPTSAEATLNVTSGNTPPTINGLTNQIVLAGNNATLSANVGGTPTPTMQWYLSTDGGASSNAIAGATGSSLSLTNVQYSQNGYVYFLYASNSVSAVVSNMTLTVTQIAPTIAGLTNQTVYSGNNTTFSATVGGAPTPTLQWLANDVPITSATNSTLILTNVHGSQNGFVYSLVATNTAGTVTSNAMLTVASQVLCINLDVNKNIYNNATAVAPDAGTNWNQLATSGISSPYTVSNLKDSQANATAYSITVAGSLASYSDSSSGNPNPINLMADYYFGSESSYTLTFSNLVQGTYALYDYAHGNALNQNTIVTLSSVNGGSSASTAASATYTSNYRDTSQGPGVAYVVLNGTVGSSGTFTFTNAPGSGGYSALNGLQLQLVSPAGVSGLTNQTVTVGNSTTLVPTVIGTTPISYQWNSNGVPITSTTNSILVLNNVQYAQNGAVYSVTASNAAGMDTNSMILTVIVTPSISGLADTAASPGTTVTLNATVGGVPAPTLQWQRGGTNILDGATGNGSIISGSTSTTLTITAAQVADSGYYSLVASNAAGLATNTVYVTISSEQAPIITGPVNQTVVQGSNATFTASVSANPAASLQWLDNTGTPILGATANMLTLNNVQYSQNGYTYSLVASNSVGMATNSATLTVLVPVSISNQPQNAVVINTQAASFTVTASGVPAPSYYQWYFNGGAISGANSATYSIASATPSNMGNYQVVVSNSVNVVTSSVATLTVNSTMGYTSLTPANGATRVCYDAPLYIRFDRVPTLRNAGKIKIYNATNASMPVDMIDLSLNVTTDPTYGVNVQAYAIGGMTITNFPVIINGTTAAIYPHQGLLTSNQTYYVTVDNGTFADNTGAYFAGISDPNAWRFTTKPTGPANITNLVVAQDYSGDFATVQGAVNFVPGGNTTPTVINIRNGVYTEFVNVNSRNNLDFRGQSRSGTIIGYPNNNNLNPGAPQRSAFIINGNDCTLETLTLTNMTRVGGGQAEAVDVEGTRAIFCNMELDSHQDTFLVHYSGKLVYFQDSLIAGDTDFNWGYGTVYYTNCELRSYGNNVTQPRNPLGQRGFGFMNCRVTAANTNVTSIGLGRSFGQTNAQALFAYCLMADAVTGFADAGSTNFSDYACSNLTATASKTLADSVHLTGSEPDAIAVQSATNWLYGWQPSVIPVILNSPTSQAVDAGQPAVFTVSATGVPAPDYQWTKNGTNLVGQTGATLAIASAQASDIADYSVVVSNSGGSVTSSIATLNLTGVTPDAPVGLFATAGVSQVVLTWSTVPAVTGYNVKRSITRGNSYVTITNTTATNLIDTAVANGTTYYYVVSAVNSQGEGADSSEVSATPECITPAVPSGFSVSAGNAQATLIWNASTYAAGYLVQRGDSANGPFSPAAAVSSTNYTDTSLVNGTTYYYVVTATNSCSSSDSTSALGVTPQNLAPVYQVNSGGSAVGSFAADSYFSGGGTYGSGSTIDTNGLVNPAPMSVYQTERNGNMTYTFTNLTAGSGYMVRLHFAELYWWYAGGREFNVSINGSQVLTNFDIYATAGANNKAVIREFTVPADGSGQIVIQFTSVVDNAKVSGIEIIPASASAPVIISQPVSQSVTAGGTAAFTVVATGNPSYQWLKNGYNLTGATNAALTITNALRADLGTYAVVVSNGGGSTVSANATLTYQDTAPVAGPSFSLGCVLGQSSTMAIIGGKYSPTDVDIGDILTITSVTGATNGTVTTDGTNVTYTATNGATDSFTYTVSDNYGLTATQTVNVSIVSAQNYNQLGTPQMVGGQAVLTFYGIPGYNYALDWATNLTPPVNWMPVMSNSAAGNGRLMLTNPTPSGMDFYRTRQVP